jgi:hypothetical protein
MPQGDSEQVPVGEVWKSFRLRQEESRLRMTSEFDRLSALINLMGTRQGTVSGLVSRSLCAQAHVGECSTVFGPGGSTQESEVH